MAKGKKKENLTPEERLQATLVPDWEQPYKVPENWCWVHLLDSFENCTDSKKKIHKKKYLQNGEIAVVDQGQELIGGYTNDREMAFTGNLPIVIFGDHTRCVKYIDFPFAQGADGVKVLKPKSFFNPKAFYYAFQSIDIPNMGYRRHFPLLAQYAMPVPPISEQQRIVNRIESLCSKLDETKQKAQNARDGFEIRKAAILHKAFTGELTAQWRKEHGIGIESWKNSTVGRVCYEVKVGIVIKPSQYYTDEKHGIPAFRSANVRENHIDDFDWVYLNQECMERNTRSIVHTGDVLVVRSGNPGTACVVSGKFDGYNAIDILIAVPNHSQVSSEFLCAYTNSPFGKRLISKNKRGMALAHFNVKGYSGLPIRVPLLQEQTEIVRLLDNLLAKEQRAKEVAEAVLEKIDIIKKSILTRAFRGELGTNDPNEESAMELLKQILTEERYVTSKKQHESIPTELKNKLETELERKIIRLYFQRDTKSLPAKEIIAVSAKEFEIMESLYNLEKRGIIKKLNNGSYKLLG